MTPQRRRRTAALVAVCAVAALAAVALARVDPSSADLSALGHLGLAVVGGLVFLEVGTPLGLVTPSELAVPLGGAAAAAGTVGLLPLVLVVWATAVLGESTGYLTGRLAGQRVRARVVRRGGRTEQRYDALVRLFARRGVRTVLLARWVPYARTATPLLAGSTRMPYPAFLLASACGCAVWAAALCSAGYAFSASIPLVAERAGQAGGGLAAVVGLVVLVAVARRRRRVRTG